MPTPKITVYATNWCGDCFRVRRFLEKNAIPYQWIDIDADRSGEEFVLKTNQGMRSVPTILFEDGSILVEPSNDTLAKKIRGFNG
jgi:glutaredoxin-like protein